MAYANYDYYQHTYLGKIIPDVDTFCTLAERSTDYVDMVTFCNVNTEVLKDKDVADKVKRCMCAIAEAYYLYDVTHSLDGTVSGVKTSERLGEYSIQWASPTDSLESLTGGNLPSYLRSLALRYLGCTGLMFRGVCY